MYFCYLSRRLVVALQEGRRRPCCCCCCCGADNWDRRDDGSTTPTTMRWFRKNEDNAPRLISLSPLRQLDSAAAADAEVANVVGWGYSPPTQQRGNYSSRLNGVDVVDASSDRPPHVHRRSRSALSDNLPGDRSSYADHHHHLPCTLKRKPAVRRRSGGKGMFGFFFYLWSSSSGQEKYNFLENKIKREYQHNCRPISGKDLLTFRIL